MGEGGEGIPQGEMTMRLNKPLENQRQLLPKIDVKQILQKNFPDMLEATAAVGIGTLAYNLCVRAGVDAEVARDTLRGMFVILGNVGYGLQTLRPHTILLPTDRQEKMFHRITRVVEKSAQVASGGYMLGPDPSLPLRLVKAEIDVIRDPVGSIKDPVGKSEELLKTIQRK